LEKTRSKRRRKKGFVGRPAEKVPTSKKEKRFSSQRGLFFSIGGPDFRTGGGGGTVCQRFTPEKNETNWREKEKKSNARWGGGNFQERVVSKGRNQEKVCQGGKKEFAVDEEQGKKKRVSQWGEKSQPWAQPNHKSGPQDRRFPRTKPFSGAGKKDAS